MKIRRPSFRWFHISLLTLTMALVDHGKYFTFNKLRLATGSHYITVPVRNTLPVRPQLAGCHIQWRNDIIKDIGPISCLGLQESLSAHSLILCRSSMAY